MALRRGVAFVLILIVAAVLVSAAAVVLVFAVVGREPDVAANSTLVLRVGGERRGPALRAGDAVESAEADHAVSNPPGSTRAYFRGRCLQKWPDAIVAANWDSLVFDVGGDPLRLVPMMEPSRGTAEHVGTLIDECETAAELLSRLGS